MMRIAIPDNMPVIDLHQRANDLGGTIHYDKQEKQLLLMFPTGVSLPITILPAAERPELVHTR